MTYMSGYIGVRDCPYGKGCPWCVEDEAWMLWEISSVVVAVVVQPSTNLERREETLF